MKKLLVVGLFLAPLFCLAQNSGAKMYNLIMGTRTRGTSNGIYVYRFNAETGQVSYLDHAEGIPDPTYLCLSNNNKFVYAVSDRATGPGSIYAYKFNTTSGKLDLLNEQPAFGGPLYVNADKQNRHLFAANYLGGVLAVYTINKDGSLGAAVQVITNKGSSVDKSRQQEPHVHTAMLSPDEKYLLSTDLGTDRLNVYQYNPLANPVLTPAPTPFVSADPGNGPRHLDFSADGKYVYLLQEMAGVITTYKFAQGNLTRLQSLSMIDHHPGDTTQAADIHVSPGGRFLYASNRGTANQVVQFAINKKNGTLTYVERYNSLGKSPRNLVIDPTGNFLLVSNQYSANVTVFKINKISGKLTLTTTAINIDAPMCIRFAPVTP